MNTSRLNLKYVEECFKQLGDIFEKDVEFPDAQTAKGKTTFETLRLCNVRKFRSLTEIPFGPGFNLIYAPNGVGKTTLTDALELIKTGVTPRARAYRVNAIEVRDGDNLVSWGKEGQKAFAELRSVNGDIYQWDTSETERFYPEAPVKSISRLNLRSRIDGKPQERFDFIRSLLPGNDFGAVVDEAQCKINAIKEQIEIAEEVLGDLQRKAEGLGYSVQRSFFSDIRTDINGLETGSRAQLDELTRLREYRTKLRSLCDDLDGLELKGEPVFFISEPKEPEADESLLAMSELVKVVDGDENCPLCLDGVLTTARVENIRKELEAYSVYNDAKAQYKQERSQFEAAKKAWDQTRSQLATLLQEIDEVEEVSDPSLNCVALSSEELEERRKKTASSLSIKLEEADQKYQEVLEADNLKKRRDLEEFWENTSDWGEDDLERNQNLRDYLAVGARRTDLNNAVDELKQLKDKIVEARLKSIKQPVLKWWDLLCPEKVDYDLEFLVKEKKKPGIDLYCVPRVLSGRSKRSAKRHAMGTLSESQVDLLAMAFNLATLEEEIGQGMVWLDDPSDSLDESNIDNFIRHVIPELLGKGYQVVLCTHSRVMVKKIWDNYSSIVEPIRGKIDWNETFRQVNLDLQPSNSSDVALNFEVVCSPFDVESAVDDFAKTFDSVDGNTGEIYRLGTRLRLANNLRRVWEFVLAEVLDSLNPLLAVREGESVPAVQERTATLGELRKGLSVKIAAIIRDVKNHQGDEKVEKQKIGLIKSLDRLLDKVNAVNAAILNEGSHASVVVPEYREIKDDWDTLQDLYGLLKPFEGNNTVETAEARFMLAGLESFYPGQKCEGLLEKIYRGAPEALD